jgi:hypothetical protein
VAPGRGALRVLRYAARRGRGRHLGVEPRGALGQREGAQRVIGGGDEQHRRGDARHRPDRVVGREFGCHAHQRAILPAALRRAPTARERLGAVSLGTAVRSCTPCACQRTLNQQCQSVMQPRDADRPCCLPTLADQRQESERQYKAQRLPTRQTFQVTTCTQHSAVSPDTECSAGSDLACMRAHLAKARVFSAPFQLSQDAAVDQLHTLQRRGGPRPRHRTA